MPPLSSATPRPFRWQPWISGAIAAFVLLPLHDDILRGGWWRMALDLFLLVGNAICAYAGSRPNPPTESDNATR